MRSPRHEEALRYAADGIPVILCETNGKRPMPGFKWQQDRTTDPEVINEAFSRGDWNIAICPDDAGWGVVDPDGSRGLENWKALCDEHGVGPTSRVLTPGGGEHHYFVGSVQASVGTESKGLAEKVDTRGRGSYVLVPPSVIDGREYQWADDCETAPLPAWIPEALANSAERITEAAVEELDLPGNIARAEARLKGLVERGDVAIEGKGGDDRTYKVAVEMLELGLTPETTLDLMWNIWNDHCIPPWDRDELGAKIDNASRYAQNAAGAFAVTTAAETFGPALDKLIAEDREQQSSPQKFPLIHVRDFKVAFSEPEWLVPDLIPAKGVVQIMGQRKSFKSFLALDLSLGLSSNTETFGYTPGREVPVVYCVGENANSFARRHVSSWLAAKGKERNFPFYVTPRVPRAAENEADVLITAILKADIKPGIVVIDTATRALRGLETNSEKDVGMFSQACDNIRDALNCTVLVLRHTGKDMSRGSRGSGALDDDADTNLLVERHEKTPAVKLTVKDQRNAEERPEPWYFEAQAVAGLSLVFRPITVDEYMQYAGQEERLDRKAVGRALKDLGATPGSKLPTPVIATELLKGSQFQTAEQQLAAVGRISKSLNALARTTLAGYAEKTAQGWVWFLTPP